MRHRFVLFLAVTLLCPAGIVVAEEKSLEQLPQDLWDAALLWTEPLKHVARETRRFDPISGLWFGLLEGSVKSVERTAALLTADSSDQSTPEGRSENPLLRYSF